MNNDMIMYQEKLKENIKELINQNRLEAAKEILIQYEGIVRDDIDVYSIKSVIAMMEGDMDEAERILCEGLDIQPFNYDILYNLAYLYEAQEKYITAYRHCKKIIKVAKDEYVLENISTKIEKLESIEKVREYKDRKKVLIVAYAFPPIGGSGIQRTLKFIRYLRDFGWEPIILTVGKTAWRMKDESLLNEIPKEIEIIRIDDVKPEEIDTLLIKEIINFYSNLIEDQEVFKEYLTELNDNLQNLSRYLFIPEYQSVWAIKACKNLDKYIDVEDIDIVYTTADPYANTFIGQFLKTNYNKKWVIDFRDEWTNHQYKEYDKNSIRYKMEYQMENTVVKIADKIITTTPISSDNYRNFFKLPKKKVETITNGYDEKDFKNIKPLDKKNNFFTIMHNGIFHDGKNPVTFLYAIANLISKGLIDKNKIKIYFTREDIYMDLVKRLELQGTVEYLGYIEHKKSLEIANTCDVLFLVVGHGEKLKQVHAAKLFEYLRLGKTILSLAPKKGVIDNLINELKRGYNVDYSDVKGIETYILKLYRDWENNKLKTFEITDDISKFERRTLTKKLSGIFEELLQKQEYEEEIDDFVESRDIKKTDFLDEMDIYTNKFKTNMKFLVEQGLLNEVKDMIVQYGEIIKDDVEIYSIEGVIAMIEGNMTEAERLFKEGLSIDSYNFDLAYNLAYLYQNTERKELAIKYYKRAFNSAKNKNDEDEIYKVLKELGVEEKIEKKKKIVFFSKGDDKFIWDIINELSKEYETKKIVITKNEEIKLIDQWMEWADICWFEWCDELIIYGSRLSIAKEKKILCRLHRYEVLTQNPIKVNWFNVDKLILVTEHLKIFLKSQIPNIEEKVDIVVINNGVNLKKYKLQERKQGYNIAYIGYIHQRKNPVLLLQIMKKLVDKDKRYKLYVAGKFQDVLIKVYWDYQVKKMNLESNIIFEGWQENIDGWLKDKNYLLSTSIHESFGYGIAEAMSRGLKPIIHNFIFSEEIWPKEYLFNTVDEAVEMIVNKEYNSIEYRRFIEENYSLSKQITEIKKVVECIDKTTKEGVKHISELQFNYKAYWEKRYQKGGNSGEGSYGKFAEFKAEVINKLVNENNIKNVIEFGSGDGNQLKYMQYKNYIGLDISPTSIELCSKRFSGDKNKKFINYVPGKLNSILKKFDMAVCLDVLYYIIDEEDFVKTLDDIFLVSAKFVVLYTFLEEPKIRLSIHLKYRNIMEYLKKYKNYSVYQIIKQKYIGESFADFIILKKKVDIINIQSIEYAINIINRFSYFTKELMDGFDFNSSRVSIGKMEKLSERYLLIEYILSDKTNKKLVLTGIILDILNNDIIYPEYIRESIDIKQIDVITRKILQSEKGKIYNSNIYGFIYDVDIMADIKLNELAYNWERAIPGTQFMPFEGYLNVALRYEFARRFINKNDVVLEAGSGFGYGAAHLSRICQQVEALDIAEENIAFGQKTYSFKNINWTKGDVTNLPYKNNNFDAYITYETLEHIPLKLVDSYLMEATRVLKKGGKFIISTPNKINRENINNPFHIKEYNFIEFDNILKQYFKDIEYYSIESNTLSRGISNGSKVMIAIAYNS